MGMYTQLNIGVNFKYDTPDNIINILKYMLDEYPEELSIESDHPLFKTDRWRIMLTCTSCYFDGHTDSSLRYAESMKCYMLNVRCNLKKYCDEIEQFIDFITQYLDTEGFLGYMRYEEDEHPTLIYNDGGTIIYKQTY